MRRCRAWSPRSSRFKKALAQAAGIKFKTLYFLPGNGTKTPGVFLQNASNDLALGLLVA